MKPDLIIAGGGLAGSLAALALAERRPDLSFVLVEQEERLGGNHIWSFFDTDLPDDSRRLVEPLIVKSWPRHDIRFPKRQRTLDIAYHSIKSDRLNEVVRAGLPAERLRLGVPIDHVAPDHVVLAGGERIEARAVIDARGPAPALGLDVAWQKFVGRTYRFDRPHGLERPIIMDATVAQHDGYRFLYSLPFSEAELMVEDTYYSDAPSLDSGGIGDGIDRHVRDAFGTGASLAGEETGVLPVLLGGKVESLWPDDLPVAKLGLRGGFFHPTTGYSLPDAAANALLLARQNELSARALHALFLGRAKALWQERRFFQLLNRMLFRAASPDQRYRVLEHFYRLPGDVIGRFYAARLSRLDKLRILSGRPPVPVARAIAAMRSNAA